MFNHMIVDISICIQINDTKDNTIKVRIFLNICRNPVKKNINIF